MAGLEEFNHKTHIERDLRVAVWCVSGRLTTVEAATQRRVAAVAEFPREAKISEASQLPDDLRNVISGMSSVQVLQSVETGVRYDGVRNNWISIPYKGCSDVR